MIHYYFYEKSLIYSCLSFYEENFYKQSILKLQDKLRTSKPDEKFRDQLIQIIERDNLITVEIIRQVKKDYLSKLEPYLNQYQVKKYNLLKTLIKFIFKYIFKLDNSG